MEFVPRTSTTVKHWEVRSLAPEVKYAARAATLCSVWQEICELSRRCNTNGVTCLNKTYRAHESKYYISGGGGLNEIKQTLKLLHFFFSEKSGACFTWNNGHVKRVVFSSTHRTIAKSYDSTELCFPSGWCDPYATVTNIKKLDIATWYRFQLHTVEESEKDE